MAWREEQEQFDPFGLELPFTKSAGPAGPTLRDHRNVEEAGLEESLAWLEVESEAMGSGDFSYDTNEGYSDEDVDASFEYDNSEIDRLIASGDSKGAVKAAIAAGERDEGKLTNLLFFAQHPELDRTRPLKPKESKADAKLAAEWDKLRKAHVVPVLVASAEDGILKVRGAHILGRLKAFKGSSGQRFKVLVETTAQKAAINPGLLAAAVIAETGGPAAYLKSGKVDSYHVGVDDFYAMRHVLAKAVPAYADIKWDRKQKPEEHPNDAQSKTRIVKTIFFDSGADALLATAVYLKYAEVRLREDAVKLNGDFDALPVETRLALIRMSMAAGRAGAEKRLVRALKGEDILKRNWAPPKKYHTDRNATIRSAEAMFLSGWIFGVPLAPTPVAKPVPESWEESEDEAESGEDGPAEESLSSFRPRKVGDEHEEPTGLNLYDEGESEREAEEVEADLEWVRPAGRVDGRNGIVLLRVGAGQMFEVMVRPARMGRATAALMQDLDSRP